MNIEQHTGTDHDPETVTRYIQTYGRRIRFYSRILSGEGRTTGHGPNPLGPEWYAEQQATLDELTARLTYWESVRDARSTTATAEYVVPVDPMDDLQCDSCQ